MRATQARANRANRASRQLLATLCRRPPPWRLWRRRFRAWRRCTATCRARRTCLRRARSLRCAPRPLQSVRGGLPALRRRRARCAVRRLTPRAPRRPGRAPGARRRQGRADGEGQSHWQNLRDSGSPRPRLAAPPRRGHRLRRSGCAAGAGAAAPRRGAPVGAVAPWQLGARGVSAGRLTRFLPRWLTWATSTPPTSPRRATRAHEAARAPRALTRRPAHAQIKAGGDGFGLKLYDPVRCGQRCAPRRR